MNWKITAMLLVSCCLAAVGQLLFRKGAVGRNNLADFFNVTLAAGLGLFGIATVLWIFSLSKAPLHTVYPFSLLTFVLVGLSSVFIFDEKVSLTSVSGWLVIILGISIAYVGSE